MIRSLIDAFLVRAEERRGSTWYELAHDRLIEPVRESNKEWRQKNLHPSLLRATDWDRAGRPESLLLRDPELNGVESWATANDSVLTDVERDFLGRSQVQAKHDADFQRQRAEQVALEDRLATELNIDRGISLCQRGRIDDGLHWLVRGLKNVREKEPLDRNTLDYLARLEIAAWRAEITSLRWFQEASLPFLAVAFSPDGRSALTGNDDRTVRLLDVDTGQLKGPPLKHDGPVWSVAFGPDGQSALTGSDDRTARLWDLASGQPKGSPLKHDGPVYTVTLSPDGRSALTGSYDKTARLRDLASGQPKGPPLKHDGPVLAVALSPDGRSVITGSYDKTARLWDLAFSQQTGPPLKPGGPIQAVGISPDGRTAMTGSWDKTARLWDLASGQPTEPPLKHDGPVNAVAFSPDGRTVLTSSNDRTARLWDGQTQKPIGRPLDHGAPVIGTASSPDGTIVLTSGSEGTIQLRHAPTQRPIGAPFSHGASVSAVAFSLDGRWIATAGWDGTAQLWRTPTAVEGSPERLALWIRVVSMKEQDESGAIRTLDLATWQEYREELDRCGGPPTASATAISPAR